MTLRTSMEAHEQKRLRDQITQNARREKSRAEATGPLPGTKRVNGVTLAAAGFAGLYNWRPGSNA